MSGQTALCSDSLKTSGRVTQAAALGQTLGDAAQGRSVFKRSNAEKHFTLPRQELFPGR